MLILLFDAAGTVTKERARELREQLEEEAADLVYVLQQKCVETLLQLTRTTLDAIKRRVTLSTRFGGESSWDAQSSQAGSRAKSQVSSPMTAYSSFQKTDYFTLTSNRHSCSTA